MELAGIVFMALWWCTGFLSSTILDWTNSPCRLAHAAGPRPQSIQARINFLLSLGMGALVALLSLITVFLWATVTDTGWNRSVVQFILISAAFSVFANFIVFSRQPFAVAAGIRFPVALISVMVLVWSGVAGIRAGPIYGSDYFFVAPFLAGAASSLWMLLAFIGLIMKRCIHDIRCRRSID